MKKQVWAGTVLVALSACGDGSHNTIVYEGAGFTGGLSSVRGDRASFVARGGPASASLEGARQAAAYQVVRHCIEYLGSSDVEWINGPDVEDSALVIEDDNVILSGRCIEP